MEIIRDNVGRFTKGTKVSFWEGKKLSPEMIEKIRQGNNLTSFWKGKHLSQETKDKISAAKSGAKHPNWQGGLTQMNERVRRTAKYRKWRQDVFERDGYTCQMCNVVGGELNADHIKPFAFFEELRLSVDNGRTLCVSCHRTTFKSNRVYATRARR